MEDQMDIVPPPRVKLRSYQQEMLDASLQRNVIVAMDTGSGKTHIATFRILAELERSSSSMLTWFVCPKVALAVQQHAVLTENLPGYLVKTLLGSDGVDKWTDQRLWDATLTNVRVVVGTPAVLADALSHGFVRMEQLALLVFDEAHNCIGNSPMNKIMRDFYHPGKARRELVPHILGLSASPVISAESSTLSQLEANLDATVATPKINRSELETYVRPPEITNVVYEVQKTDESSGCATLLNVTRAYDFSTDPYVADLEELVGSGDDKAARKLDKVLLKRHTSCFDQLCALRRRALVVQEQLGVASADWYINKCCQRFFEGITDSTLILADVSEKERAHLGSLLARVQTSTAQSTAPRNLQHALRTDKVKALVAALERHKSESTRVLIFVEQRAIVAAVYHLLSTSDDKALDTYTFGTFVGTSTSDKRKLGLSDLADVKHQQQDLEGFRSGRINAMIATSVLEEGIDISACNLVMCFDLPMNLVAYVQRRGRARQQRSKYIMFMAADDTKASPAKWSRLEEEMRQAYMDEQRQSNAGDQEREATDSRSYRVESTGALLTLDDAKAHLYHFCQLSASQSSQHVNLCPEFITEKKFITDKNSNTALWEASVSLPSCVHPTLRIAKASRPWPSEETAIKDAAFEAYIALHKGGLVNDNLLPLTRDYGPEPGQVHVDQPSTVRVAAQHRIIKDLCNSVALGTARWHEVQVIIHTGGNAVVSLSLYLPTTIPSVTNFTLFWNESTRYTVDIQLPYDEVETLLSEVDESLAQEGTDLFLRSVHGSRMQAEQGRLPFLISMVMPTATDDLATKTEAAEFFLTERPLEQCGLVRVKGQIGRAYFVSRMLPPTVDQEVSLEVTTFPKRKDFLHPVPESNKTAAYTAKQILAASQCTVDALPAKYALFAAFVPAILHRIEVAMLATDLRSNVLRDVTIKNDSLILEAISSPSAQEGSDYNRLEFLGDCVLKFCAVLHVIAKHPTWPEGYLSLEKSRMVSNNVLTKAAMDAGLDKYIILNPFTGAKWRPPYVDEELAVENDETREMSSKVLADVVEALIGASFADGGLENAYKCIRLLLPAEEWIPQDESIAALSTEDAARKTINLDLLEQLIGHHFTNPSLLLEALTHASFPQSSVQSSCSSYERLEFLGDAVLDLIIVPKLHAHSRKLRHWDLHRTRDALVNGHYLALRCMEYSVAEEQYIVDGNLKIKNSDRRVHLHDFLRAGAQLARAKRSFLQNSRAHRATIKQSLANDDEYPWPDLIALNAPKFLSDIVESTLGALYLDTNGSLSACEAFIARLGILDDLEIILEQKIETAYPKEQIGILADRKGVKYTVSSEKTEEGVQIFDCIVVVGEEAVATVIGCSSREEAELRAARSGTRVLEAKLAAEGGARKRKLDVGLPPESGTVDT